MSNVVMMKGSREAPKLMRSSMETLIISADQVNQWKVPPFQRPVRVNGKVATMAEEMKQNGCEITGVITLGTVAKGGEHYVVDGQHRLEAFRISGMSEIIADVRIVHFDTMAEMADEFVRLNSAIVRMRPDDILRGLEPTSPHMQAIRRVCPFVGFDNIRRGGTSGPILSMAAVIRCWFGSSTETPGNNSSMGGVAALAASLDEMSTSNLNRFLLAAHGAWGRDPEYYRLWGNLNLTICMWLWRRLVLDPPRGPKRSVVLNAAQFKQCLMTLSADHNYLEWLPGRLMRDTDRSPAYNRIKAAFVRRLSEEARDGKTPLLPAPAWFSKR